MTAKKRGPQQFIFLLRFKPTVVKDN